LREKPNRIFGFPRNIFFLGLTSLFNDFSSEMVLAVFPAFLTSVLKSGAASLGLVDGIAEAASNIFKIYSGRLSDRFQRRKPLVVFGYTLSVLTRPFFPLVSNVGGALGLRVLDRVGKGLRDAPRDAIISLSTTKGELGVSFGFHRALDTTGAILGPLVAYFILRAFPERFDAVFGSAFIIGILALCTLFFIKDVVATLDESDGVIRRSFSDFPTSFRLYLFSVLLLSIGTVPVAVLLLKVHAVGLILADIPLFYAVYGISYAAFSTSAGKLSDRIGPRTVIVVGYIALLAGYLVLNLASSTGSLVAGFFVLGLFPALTDGVQRSMASQLTGPAVRGSALGLLNAATGIGALIAGVGGGYLWQAFGPATACIVGSIVVVVGLAAFSRIQPA
jgi:MFS family permease